MTVSNSKSDTPKRAELQQILDQVMPCDCSFKKGFAYKRDEPCDGSCWPWAYKRHLKELLTKWHEQEIAEARIDTLRKAQEEE